MGKTINERQKLAALAMRFYQGMEWEPKVGDYYCLTRADLELFQIRDSDDENFFIRIVGPNDPQDFNDPWPIADFQKGFGINRVWVHPSIFEHYTDTPYNCPHCGDACELIRKVG